MEITSPSDRAGEVLAKARWWLEHEVEQVWQVDPETRTVTVYHRDGSVRLLTESDTLTAEPVLPGFSLPLAELFK